MEPRFVQLPEMKIVGLGARFISILSKDKNNSTVIPELWQQFLDRQAEIQNQAGDSYGLVEELAEKKHPAEMFYLAGVEVADLDAVPEGMLSRVLPAGQYASFTHRGKMDKLGATMGHIYGVWLPSKKSQMRSGPHLERYDRRFRIGSDDSEFDILLPVR